MDKEALRALLGDELSADMLAPIDLYLDELAFEDSFPVLAIAVCTARIEESGPVLRALVDRAADGEPLAVGEERQLFLGLHILGGARDTLAWQPLCRLLRRPSDDLEMLLGDAITETLGRIVAGIFDGDADTLFGLIVDLTIDEFVREALLRAATFLAWNGSIEADRMRQFLIDLHEQRAAPDEDVIWIGWLDAIATLGLRSLAPRVHRAWNEGRIMPQMVDREEFEEDLAAAERAPDDAERISKAGLGYIDDVLEALQWANHSERPYAAGDHESLSWPEPPSYVQMPVTNPYRHVGRNDPCPCGSGKKAKKCCLP